MAVALDAARVRLARVARTAKASALVVERGGYASGPDSLVAALLAEAGLNAPSGAPGGLGGFVALERLLVMSPDLIVLKDPPAQAADQGSLLLLHPALRARYPANRRIVLPTRYAMCGGPALIEALNYLADALPRLTVPR
jgi:iron complex transport system substrate-binding protein